LSETALVTGASSGIGRAFCQVLAEHGYSLILVARREKLLEAVAAEARLIGVAAEIEPVDLTDSADAEALAKRLSDRRIDVFINNAGLGSLGAFLDTPLATHRNMIDLNIAAYTRVFHTVARGMTLRRAGRILNVASVASFQPGPLMSVYYATKVYALHLSEAVAEELAPLGVSVTALCPGPTRTPFHAAAGMDERTMQNASMPTTREIAEHGYESMMRGKRVALYGNGFRAMILAERVLPRRLVRRVVWAMQRRRQ
jgi:hypothetical protein